MGVIALAYFLHPGARHFLEHLALLKGHLGLLFSFLGTSLASSLLPELLTPLLVRPHRTTGPGLLERLLFSIPFWGLIGMQVDLFYRLQYMLFGPTVGMFTLVTKVLVDAFLYCPLLAIPQAVCVILWRDHGYSFRGFAGHRPADFYALKVFPVLMANWMVWIPVVCVIYSLPPPLGIPLFIIAQSFWVMVFSTMSARRLESTAGI